METDNSSEKSEQIEKLSFDLPDLDRPLEGQSGAAPPQNSKKGCRYGFLFLFLAISGLLFLCAGIFFFMKLTPQMTNDIEEVEEIKNEIAKTEIPDGYTDQIALTTDNFVYKLNLIIYGYEETGSRLVLVDFKVKILDDENQEEEMLNNILLQMGLIPESQENIDEPRNEIDIDGKPIEYDFIKGIDVTTGSESYMIRGPIPHADNETAELIYLTETEENLLNGVDLIQKVKPK